MADTPGSSGEERHLLDLLAKSALNDYPNPQRVGCPGPEFLRTLAFNRKSIPLDDSRLDHVVHCSPCFAEFTSLRSAAKRRRRRISLAFGAAAAVLIIVFGLWATGSLRNIVPSRQKKSTTILAQIDLQHRSITRGVPASSEKVQRIVIPRGHLQLSILLPVGSEPGTYEVAVLKNVDKPVITGSGQASIIDGITTLKIPMNTSSVPSGNYLLGLRQSALDWVYDPITLQ